MTDQDETTTARHTRAVHLLSQMEGFEGSELAKARVSAWDYYLQRPRGDEVEGRSPVVTGDVSSMVESTLSQVTEALATDQLAEFQGYNEQDEFQAKLEGAVVSAVVMSGPGWFRLAAAVKNALLLRMGVMRADVVTIDEVSVVALENVDVLAKAALENEGAKFVEYDEQARTARIERRETMQRVDIVNVNPENFLFVRWPLDDFENIPACAERFVGTRQQLIDDEGISEAEVDALAKFVSHKSDAAAHAPKSYLSLPQMVSKRQELLEWFVEYYLHEGKRYRCVVVGIKVLKEEVASQRPPFAIGVPFINPGHIDGFSIYDKLKSTQDITTALTRMLNDNANAVTMNRIAVIQGACNSDQLTDQDPSGVLQFARAKVGGDIRNGVMPLQVQDLTGGLVTSLQYQRTVRSEMGGASLDVGTGQVQLPDRMGSMGLDRAYSASEQLSSLILKTFSQTLIKDLWLLVHELLRTEWTGALPIKVQGRWEQPEPSKWQRRRGVTVKPGMSPGERQRRSAALGNLIQLQTELAKADMEDVLVNAERYYRTVCDWARLNDIPNPEQYLIDPTTDEAKQALVAKAQSRQAQAQGAQRLQEMALALEQMGKALEKYGIDVKAAVEKYRIDSQSEQKEAELTVDLVKSREKADSDLKRGTPAEANGKSKSEGEEKGGAADAD